MEPQILDLKVREPFHVDDLGKADWVLEVLGCSDARKEENARIAKEAHRRVDAWLAQVTGQEDRDTAGLRAELARFMALERATVLGGRTEKKSRSLPHGVLGYRSPPRRLEYEDEPAALAWARSRPLEEGLVRVEWKVNRDALRLVAEREGMTPPGTRWVGGEEAEESYAKPSAPVLPARALVSIEGGGTP